MCGIAGLINSHGVVNISYCIKPMIDIISHRGPDDEGIVVLSRDGHYRTYGGQDTPEDCYRCGLPYQPVGQYPLNGADAAEVVLGHRRLSIIDISSAGHQPLCYDGGRYWITYNGEVYNYIEIRQELAGKGYAFLSGSDTEVILAAYREWGTECLKRFNGMFAFIIYDTMARKLFIARDRYGVKPLYYWFSTKGFLAVASEIKQFTVLPGWRPKLNNDRTYDFLGYGMTDHTAETMFAGVKQLRGGQYIECGIDEISNDFVPRQWYELKKVSVTVPFEQAAEEFRDLFEKAVRFRLRADVPLGTGLSGGLDSSSIVCMIDKVLKDDKISIPQYTFSARSHHKEFDEGEFIAEVVGRTAVKAYYTFPDVDDLFAASDKTIWHHDEPFTGTSVFAEWKVFELVAGTPVKVTLDGHGSDELLAGYHAFFGPYYASLIRRGRLFRLLAEIRSAKNSHGYGYATFLKAAAQLVLPQYAAEKITSAYKNAVNNFDWINTSKLNLEIGYRPINQGICPRDISTASLSQLLYTSLPKQLHWADRDSMAHSIESRAPFLDYRLVEFIFGCPDDYKLKNATTKRMLRQGLTDVLPPKIASRRDKMGFVTPEEVWVRKQNPQAFLGAIRDTVEKAGGIINDSLIARVAPIIEGRQRYDNIVWRIVSFGRWMELFSLKL